MQRKEKSHQETFHLLQDVLKLKGLHLPRTQLHILLTGLCEVISFLHVTRLTIDLCKLVSPGDH